jgi:hypothetical protein
MNLLDMERPVYRNKKTRRHVIILRRVNDQLHVEYVVTGKDGWYDINYFERYFEEV